MKTPDISFDSPEVCFDCGKVLAPNRKHKLMVNYDNAWGRVILPDATPEHGEYGLQYVGSECAKKLPREYVIIDPEAE